MSKFLASVIDFMNHDAALSKVHTPTEKINKILSRYNNREFEEESIEYDHLAGI